MAGLPDDDEVQCVVIPLTSGSLLLPNVCVAEILPWRRIKPLPDAPDWFAGVLGWRGEMLPVVSYEALAEGMGDSNPRGRCMIVMNRSSGSWGTAFYALIASGLPRLVAVAAEDLDGECHGSSVYEALRVELGTELVVIPDLPQLEQELQKFGFGS